MHGISEKGGSEKTANGGYPSAFHSAAHDGVASPPLSPQPRPRLRWQATAVRVWRLGLALAVVYVVTLSIFPGFLAEDVKVGGGALRTWTALHLASGRACVHGFWPGACVRQFLPCIPTSLQPPSPHMPEPMRTRSQMRWATGIQYC